MRTIFVMVLVIGPCLAKAGSWVRYKFEVYPTMYEYTELRSVTNATSADITAETQSHSGTLACAISGSPNNDPPWSNDFKPLQTWSVSWSGSSGGTVHAMKIRRWELKVANNGGEEGWTCSGTGTTCDRLRIVRSFVNVISYETDLVGGGGDPG